MKRGIVRKTVALLSSIALLATLTACSSSGSTTECTPLAESGSAVDKVKVDGSFGKAPTAEFPAPLHSDKTERKVLVNGSGEPAVAGGAITVDYTIYNGDSGELLAATSYDGTDTMTSTLSETGLLPGLVKALQCSTPGSQIAAVLAPADIQVNGAPLQGLDKTTSIIMVADVISTSLTKANGAPQPPVDGMPTVVLAEDGTPGITVPKTDPPTELEVAVLQQGSGVTVKKTDTVLVQYTGVLWSDGSQFDSSWTTNDGQKKNQPVSFSLEQVIPGFTQAIAGQKVGSQIIAVIPPELGYQDGETRVFVIDILAVQ